MSSPHGPSASEIWGQFHRWLWSEESVHLSIELNGLSSLLWFLPPARARSLVDTVGRRLRSFTASDDCPFALTQELKDLVSDDEREAAHRTAVLAMGRHHQAVEHAAWYGRFWGPRVFPCVLPLPPSPLPRDLWGKLWDDAGDESKHPHSNFTTEGNQLYFVAARLPYVEKSVSERVTARVAEMLSDLVNGRITPKQFAQAEHPTRLFSPEELQSTRVEALRVLHWGSLLSPRHGGCRVVF